MVIKYNIHNSPVHKENTLYKVSTFSDIGQNLKQILNDYGYAKLESYKYPLFIKELDITIKEIVWLM